jgi:hypothetical protein
MRLLRRCEANSYLTDDRRKRSALEPSRPTAIAMKSKKDSTKVKLACIISTINFE